MSTMPRSDSLAAVTVATFSWSAFFLSSSLVMSETARWASAACVACSTPRAMTIWFFHRGMVLTMVDWIFSAITALLFCTRRICGAVWMATWRVSSRS